MTATITGNSTTTFTPTAGNVYDQVVITVAVPSDIKPEEHLIETISQSGTYNYSPSAGYVFADAAITVDVAPQKPEETFDVTPNNTDTNVTPTTAGDVFSGGVVRGYNVDGIYEAIDDINTGDPGEDVGLYPGQKFGGCTWSAVPMAIVEAINNSEDNSIGGGDYFYNNSSLKTLPDIDYRKFTNVNSMYSSSGLEVISLNSDSITEPSNMFSCCYHLTRIDELNLPNAAYFNYTFSDCVLLKSVPEIVFSSHVADVYSMFNGCVSLDNVVLDLSNISMLDYHSSFLFGEYNNLPFLESLTLNNELNCTLNLQTLNGLSLNSVKSVLTAAAAATNLQENPKLTFGVTVEDPQNELSALISACTALGWTITGLNIGTPPLIPSTKQVTMPLGEYSTASFDIAMADPSMSLGWTWMMWWPTYGVTVTSTATGAHFDISADYINPGDNYLLKIYDQNDNNNCIIVNVSAAEPVVDDSAQEVLD